jgi:hypothetical protein
MTISAGRVWFDNERMWVGLADGRTLGVPLTWFPRLLAATPAQRANFAISASGHGLHWEELDEDISVTGLLLGLGDQTVKHSTAASYQDHGAGDLTNRRPPIPLDAKARW